MDIVELFRKHAKVRVRTEEVVQVSPRRRYRRPDLQRLANRWYGVDKWITYQVEVTAKGGLVRYLKPSALIPVSFIDCPPYSVQELEVVTVQLPDIVSCYERADPIRFQYDHFADINRICHEAEYLIRANARLL